MMGRVYVFSLQKEEKESGILRYHVKTLRDKSSNRSKRAITKDTCDMKEDPVDTSSNLGDKL